MASISKQPNGRRTIQFVSSDQTRKSIRLGRVTQRDAEAIKLRVEHLIASSISGSAIDSDTARWVAGLNATLRDRLERVGLLKIDDQNSNNANTLADFVDQYIATRVDVKAATLTIWNHTRRNLVDYFGARKLIHDITEGDAETWRLSLVSAKLAESTIRKRCGFAKQFFQFAVKQRLIESNPFAGLKSAAKANPKRFYFVSRSEAEAVLDHCPDSQWRLLFALVRYAGLRCPSEPLALRWSDIDWDKLRITVHSSKTEHHEGKESRVVPIFPEILPYLQAVWEEAEDGSEFVISRYRDTNANLRTRLKRIIKRAGLNPWQKLFQNCRSTRETELAEEYPLHVVCAWIGNTQAVAQKHYLQVTEDHFSKAVHNPVQHPAESARNDPQAVRCQPLNTLEMQRKTAACENMRPFKVEDRGLEPLTF